MDIKMIDDQIKEVENMEVQAGAILDLLLDLVLDTDSVSEIIQELIKSHECLQFARDNMTDQNENACKLAIEYTKQLLKKFDTTLKDLEMKIYQAQMIKIDHLTSHANELIQRGIELNLDVEELDKFLIRCFHNRQTLQNMDKKGSISTRALTTNAQFLKSNTITLYSAEERIFIPIFEQTERAIESVQNRASMIIDLMLEMKLDTDSISETIQGLADSRDQLRNTKEHIKEFSRGTSGAVIEYTKTLLKDFNATLGNFETVICLAQLKRNDDIISYATNLMQQGIESNFDVEVLDDLLTKCLKLQHELQDMNEKAAINFENLVMIDHTLKLFANTLGSVEEGFFASLVERKRASMKGYEQPYSIKRIKKPTPQTLVDDTLPSDHVEVLKDQPLKTIVCKSEGSVVSPADIGQSQVDELIKEAGVQSYSDVLDVQAELLKSLGDKKGRSSIELELGEEQAKELLDDTESLNNTEAPDVREAILKSLDDKNDIVSPEELGQSQVDELIREAGVQSYSDVLDVQSELLESFSDKKGRSSIELELGEEQTKELLDDTESLNNTEALDVREAILKSLDDKNDIVSPEELGQSQADELIKEAGVQSYSDVLDVQAELLKSFSDKKGRSSIELELGEEQAEEMLDNTGSFSYAEALEIQRAIFESYETELKNKHAKSILQSVDDTLDRIAIQIQTLQVPLEVTDFGQEKGCFFPRSDNSFNEGCADDKKTDLPPTSEVPADDRNTIGEEAERVFNTVISFNNEKFGCVLDALGTYLRQEKSPSDICGKFTTHRNEIDYDKQLTEKADIINYLQANADILSVLKGIVDRIIDSIKNLFTIKQRSFKECKDNQTLNPDESAASL